MHAELTLLAALLVGLAGSGHCLGMCGGIAGALGSRSANRGAIASTLHALAYNLGRIGSYALAGALVGLLGYSLGAVIDVAAWSGLLRLVTGGVMIALGAYLLLDWSGLRRIESLGAHFWKRLAPLARHLLAPSGNPARALAMGAVWGFLPCGLVYTMLLSAAVSGSPQHGAALMAAFGLGTLPAMTGVTAAGGLLRNILPRLRRVGGALILAFGLWTVATPLWHTLLAGHAMQAVH